MKKLLSILLVMVMSISMLGVVPFFSSVASAESQDAFTYTVANGEVTITDFDTSYSGSVVIPDTFEGYPVTSIGNSAFSGCTGITHVTIPYTVITIGVSAFNGCSNLTSVDFSNQVTRILDGAFYGCTKLEEVWFLGTDEDWEEISISSYNDSLKNATRTFYATEAPAVSELPATEVPDAGPILTMNSAPYFDGYTNGCEDCTFADGVLSMTKTFENGGAALVWADFVIGEGELTADTAYTLEFTATVSGGVMNSWDGYAIRLRNRAAFGYEIFRMWPTAAGVSYTVGAGQDRLASIWESGEHDYALVFTANVVTAYCDGVELYTQPISFTGDMHAFSIAAGHSEATGCALTMSNFALYEGDLYGAIDIPATEAPATEAPATEAPAVSELPATEEPTYEPATEEPVVSELPATEAPTSEIPATSTLFTEYDLGDYYLNGRNGSVSYNANSKILTMVKDEAGSNFNVIYWSDEADNLTDTMTLMFDAKLSGGYIGNPWDGFAIGLRDTSSSMNCEMLRLVPTSYGTEITRGAGNTTLATLDASDYVAYSCQYNKANDTLTVYANGIKILDEVALDLSGNQHGFFIHSGHNDATGVELKIADLELWSGETVRTAPGTYNEATEEPVVTAAPSAITEEPMVITEAPVVTEVPSFGLEPILTMNSNPYWNAALGANSSAPYRSFADGVLTITKGFAAAGDALVWADHVIGTGELTADTTYTLKFTAAVSGGVMNNWDGYAIKLRNKSAAEYEIFRFYPTTVGIDYTVGAGATKLASVWTLGEHDYELVFTASSVTAYCDGEELYTKAISFTGDMHAFSIAAGHNAATGCALTMSNFALYEGDVHGMLDVPVTEVPATYAPATEVPATAVPATETPSADPILTMNNVPYWNANANDCDDCTFEAGVLSMTKTFTSGGDALVWADAVIGADELTANTTYTLKFTAAVSGGVMNSWDGYAISLWNRDMNQYEIFRMWPTAVGVDYTVGAGANRLASVYTSGSHDYELVFTANAVTAYCDGVELYTQPISFTGDMWCFAISTGHNDATGCALTMSDFALYEGGFHGGISVPVTEAPATEVPVTEAPMGAPKVSIGDVRAKVGSTVEVDVILENTNGFADLGLEIGYDSSVLTLVEVTDVIEKGSFTTAQEFMTNPYTLDWNNASNMNYNGVLATLTFEVSEDAPKGEYPITVSYYKGRNGDYIDGDSVNYDEDFLPLGLTYEDGTVEIYVHTPGDINDDGTVTNKDATYLLRYLASWTLDELDEDALDVNGDGVINNKDATILLRYLAGWDVTIY